MVLPELSVAMAEPFAAFETRIHDALREAARPGARVLCITSGGVIANVMRRALGLGPEQMAHVLLPIYNSSLHRFRIDPTLATGPLPVTAGPSR